MSQNDTTFQTLSHYRESHTIHSINDLKILHTFDPDEMYILGGGANTLMATHVNTIMIKNMIKDREIIKQSGNEGVIRLGSAEIRDDIVRLCIDEYGWGGIENLSAIPGTLGGAIVQNIGAYGCEIQEVIQSVEIYDWRQQQFFSLSPQECQFGYRHSIFKTPQAHSRYITHVTLRLTTHQHTLKTSYQGIDPEKDTTPRLISQTIRTIRSQKLPDWTKIGTAGSFFTNPIVSESEKNRLLAYDPDLPCYTYGGQWKLSAGYILEKTVGKGYHHGPVSTYIHHALVLVAIPGTPGDDVIAFVRHLQQKVWDKRHIWLLNEVLILDPHCGPVLDNPHAS